MSYPSLWDEGIHRQAAGTSKPMVVGHADMRYWISDNQWSISSGADRSIARSGRKTLRRLDNALVLITEGPSVNHPSQTWVCEGWGA